MITAKPVSCSRFTEYCDISDAVYIASGLLSFAMFPDRATIEIIFWQQIMLVVRTPSW